jgi:hypothetical protein
MKTLKVALIMLAIVITGSCVTINVYFPAASAEKAAEKFVGEVLGEPQEDGSLLGPQDPRSGRVFRFAGEILDYLCQAPGTAGGNKYQHLQINAIKERMAQRQRDSLMLSLMRGPLVSAMTDWRCCVTGRQCLGDRRNSKASSPRRTATAKQCTKLRWPMPSGVGS